MILLIILSHLLLHLAGTDWFTLVSKFRRTITRLTRRVIVLPGYNNYERGVMIHIVMIQLPALIGTARKLGIPVIPQVINFGEESFLEGVDLDYASFMARLKRSKDLPKTAAPPVEEFLHIFERLTPTKEPILCIHPSTDVSGTVRSAQTAAAEFPGRYSHPGY
jgi:hypothetical protein